MDFRVSGFRSHRREAVFVPYVFKDPCFGTTLGPQDVDFRAFRARLWV